MSDNKNNISVEVYQITPEVLTDRQRDVILKALRHNQKLRQRMKDLGKDAGVRRGQAVMEGMEYMIRLLFGVQVWLELVEQVEQEFDAQTKLNEDNEREIVLGNGGDDAKHGQMGARMGGDER